MLNYYEFVGRYTIYAFREGRAFDQYDVNVAWRKYQESPVSFNYLIDAT